MTVQSPAAVALQTMLQTLEQMAPVMVAGAASAGAINPQLAMIAQMVPIVQSIIQTANQLRAASAMTSDELDTLFKSIGTDLQATHNAWQAMNQGAPA